MAPSSQGQANDDRELERDLFDALARDDVDRAASAAEELGNGRFFLCLTAMLAASVERVWPTGVAPDQLPLIARSIAEQVSDESAPPALVEASIRAALGEVDQLEGISPEARTPAYVLIIKTAVRTEITDAVGREALARTALEILGDG